MTNNKLTSIDIASLSTVTGGGLFGPRSTVGDTPGSIVQNDSKGLFRSLFGKRDPNAVPSPLPNLREIFS